MTLLIGLLFSIASIITAFYSPFLAWIIIAIPSVLLLIVFVHLKNKQWNRIPELSEEANKMIQRYGHYFSMPILCRHFSASSGAFMFAGLVIAIIGVFKDFWWGIAIAVTHWCIMGILASEFNPAPYIKDSMKRLAYEEITSHLLVERIDHKINEG